MKTAQLAQQPVLVAVENEAQLKKPIAVVIDDDEATTLYLTEFLLERGWAVYAYCSATEGLRDLLSARVAEPRTDSQLPCDLVFTDLKMPEMDGLTLLKEIHKKYPSLPVVLMTAYASIHGAVDAIHDGAFDYLPKPLSLVRISTLLEKLSQGD